MSFAKSTGDAALELLAEMELSWNDPDIGELNEKMRRLAKLEDGLRRRKLSSCHTAVLADWQRYTEHRDIDWAALSTVTNAILHNKATCRYIAHEVAHAEYSYPTNLLRTLCCNGAAGRFYDALLAPEPPLLDVEIFISALLGESTRFHGMFESIVRLIFEDPKNSSIVIPCAVSSAPIPRHAERQRRWASLVTEITAAGRNFTTEEFDRNNIPWWIRGVERENCKYHREQDYTRARITYKVLCDLQARGFHDAVDIVISKRPQDLSLLLSENKKAASTTEKMLSTLPATVTEDMREMRESIHALKSKFASAASYKARIKCDPVRGAQWGTMLRNIKAASEEMSNACDSLSELMDVPKQIDNTRNEVVQTLCDQWSAQAAILIEASAPTPLAMLAINLVLEAAHPYISSVLTHEQKLEAVRKIYDDGEQATKKRRTGTDE